MNEPKLKPFAAVLMAQGLSAVAQTNSPGPSAFNAAQLPEVTVQGQRGPAFKADQVSSPKYTQPIVDTPQTIVAIPREIYAQQGAQTLSDVLRNTPGISFAAGEGGNVASGDSFFMRGSDTSGNIFVDGVRDTGAYSRDVFEVEQVEIFKGPTGADSGRGSSSGYVNLATKTPQLDPAQAGELSFGSAAVKRGTLDVNQPLGTGRTGDWINGSSLRLNLMAQDGGVVGRDYVKNQRWGVAPALGMGLGTPTRWYFAGSWVEQDNLPDSGLPVAAAPGGVLGRVRQQNFYGLPEEDFDRITSGRGLHRLEHDVNENFTLRNQLVFVRTDRDALTSYIQNAASINPGTGSVTPRRLHVQTENEIFSEQLNGTLRIATGKLEHDLSAGLELTRESQQAPTWVAVNGPATSVFTPDPFRGATAAQTPYRTNNAFADGRIDTAALYLFDTVKFSDAWQFNGSLRAEHYQTEFDSISPAGAPLSVETDDALLSWKTGVVFKPRANGSVYAAYANSFTPPGTGFTLSTNANNANNPAFAPQESVNYEAGTKWEFFNQRLLAGLAVYRTENRNNIVQDSGTLQYFQDADNIIHGVELQVTGKVTEQWMVQGGVGYLDSEYRAPANSSGAANNGAELRFTPEWTANLWTTYRFKSGFTLGAGANYSAAVVRATAGGLVPTATAGVAAPEFVLFDAMLSYDFNANLTVRLNLYNLTDAEYYRLNNNGGRFYPGAARSFTLALALRF